MESQLEPRSLDRLVYLGSNEAAFSALSRVSAELADEVFDSPNTDMMEGLPDSAADLRRALLCIDGRHARALETLRGQLSDLSEWTVLLLLVADDTETISTELRRRADAVYPLGALDSPALIQTVRGAHERRSLKREIDLNRKAIDSARHGIVLTDARLEDDPLVFCNTKFYEMTGYTPGEVLGRNCRFLQSEHTDGSTVRQIGKAIDAGTSITTRLRNERSDGTVFWNRLSISPIRNREGRLTHFLGIQEDVTDRVERERQLTSQRSELRVYEKIVENATDAVSVTDGTGRYVLVNQSFAELVGTPREEILGSQVRDVFTHEFGRRAETDRFEKQPSGAAKVVEETLTVQGEERIFSTVIVPIGQRGERRTVCIRREVTGRRRMEERLEHRAHHDDLTGLVNRKTFRRRLETALRTGTAGVVAFIDLDDFKRINDTHGHATGDRVLVELAERLRDCTRSDDVAARIGGDEFVVLLSTLTDQDAIRNVHERLNTIFEAPVDLDDTTVQVDGTVGIAELSGEPLDEQDPSERADDILREADRAMYENKQ